MKYDIETPDLPPVYSTAKAPMPSVADIGSIPESAAFGDGAAFTPEQTAAPRIRQLEDIISANYQLAQYDGVGRGKQNAIEDAAEARIKGIKQALGQDVPNPFRGGYMDEAMASYAKENPRFLSSPLDNNTAAMPSPYRPITANDVPRINQLQTDAFQRRLRELQDTFPDKADIIGANRPIDTDARELANAAQKKASDLASSTSGIAPFVAGMVGGVAGSWRDPMQVAALFAGGPEVKGGTALYRIMRAGLEQAAINAGVAALEQPQVQSWRKERGQETGLIPAAKDIGIAALFGAIPGAGIEAGKIGWQKYGREFFERAMHGDNAAAQGIANDLPREMSPELYAARQAQWADDYAKMSASINPAFEPLDYAEGWEKFGAFVDTAKNKENASAIDAAAREAHPELFAQADELDSLLEIGRNDLAANITRFEGMARPEIDFVERLQASLKRAEEAAKIRNDEPMPNSVEELRDRALALPEKGNAKFRRAADEFEQLAQTAQERRWPEDDFNVVQHRMELADLQRQRALIGPRVAEARQEAADRLGVSVEQSFQRDAHKEALADAYAQAIRHLEDPSEPLPEVVAPERGDGGAEPPAAIKDARTSIEAADALRDDRAALSQALSSSDPRVRDAAKLASLSDEAYEMVRTGEVSPAVAIEVGARVPNAADQAAVLREVAEQRPATRHEAAALTTETIAREKLPDDLAILLGSDEPPARTIDAPVSEKSIVDQQWDEVEKLEAEFGLEFGGGLKTEPPKDSLDTVPFANMEDGSDMVALSRDEMLQREPREGFLAGVVMGCPGK